MKRILQLLCSLCFLSGILTSPNCSGEENSKPILRVLNWSEYIAVDDDPTGIIPVAQRAPSLRAFAEKFNCGIEYYEYEDTPDMLKTVENVPGFYDVLITSHAEVMTLIAGNKVVKYDKSLLPNYSFLDPAYTTFHFDKKGEYLVPYLVGTTGILYRKDLVGGEVSSWKQLFEPAPHLKGKVNLFDDPLLCFPMALQSLGHDPNTQEAQQIKQAGRLIYNLNKNGFLFSRTADIELIKQGVTKGDIAITPMYSGDALTAIEDDETGQLAYVIPDDGGEFYVDCFVILAHSTKKKLAHSFVNYMIDPKEHATNAAFLQYLCPNLQGIKELKTIAPEQLDNPAIYPPAKVIRKLEVYSNHHSEIYRLWNKVFK